MEPGPGNVAAPDHSAGLHVGEVAEGFSSEEVLADVRDAPLDFRFPRRVAGHGGIDDEAAELGVLEEDTVDRRGVAIGQGDRGLEIVGFGTLACGQGNSVAARRCRLW